MHYFFNPGENFSPEVATVGISIKKKSRRLFSKIPDPEYQKIFGDKICKAVLSPDLRKMSLKTMGGRHLVWV